MSVAIEVLSAQAAEVSRDALAGILSDCVAGGASISFMWPFTDAEALAWADRAVEAARAGRTVLFGARSDGDLVGSVQLGLDTPPNQPHRGDVTKLIVHRRMRNQGVAARLMTGLADEARRRGLTLLTLDTATGSSGERLYERLGWTRVGIIPGYALWPDGRPCDTTVFWLRL